MVVWQSMSTAEQMLIGIFAMICFSVMFGYVLPWFKNSNRQKTYFVSFTYKTNYGYEFGNCLFRTTLDIKDEKGLNKMEACLFDKVKKTADVQVVILLNIERM